MLALTKTKAPDVTDGSGLLSFIDTAEALGAVFNHEKVILFGNLHYRVQISHHPVKMHYNNGLCSLRNFVFNIRRVKGVGLIHVGENRQSTRLKNTKRGSDERI